MPNILYCAHCDGALIYRNIDGHNIYMCPICSAIYEKIDEQYKYIGTLSGGKAIKEMINNLSELITKS